MGDCTYCGKRRINFNQDEDYTMRIENNDRRDYVIVTGELMIDSIPISFFPFCGRHSTIIRSEQVSASGMTLYAVRCYRCGADGPKVYSYGGEDQNLAKETAAVFWNGRASDEGDDRLRAQ